jgi:hypothetical protein
MAAAAVAPPAEIEVHLLLVGDAGYATSDDPVMSAMIARAAQDPEHTVVVFLGDNVYPRGLPDSSHPDRATGEQILLAQAQVARASGARGIFVPGNHDWAHSGEDGWEAVKRQERFIERRTGPRVALVPSGGCPGPVTIDVESVLRLVVMDTQWWLHAGPKPTDPLSDCPADSESEVADALAAALAAAGGRQVVVVAHHPLATTGGHGGYFDWKVHIFPLRRLASWLWIPLPFIGSAYPLARNFGISDQDLSSSRYRHMRAALDSALVDHPPLVWAGGHDHSLQVMEGSSVRYNLVSGGGPNGHLEPVWWGERTLYAGAKSGFMQIDFMRDGRARLGVLVVDDEGNISEEFSMWLRPDA